MAGSTRGLAEELAAAIEIAPALDAFLNNGREVGDGVLLDGFAGGERSHRADDLRFGFKDFLERDLVGFGEVLFGVQLDIAQESSQAAPAFEAGSFEEPAEILFAERLGPPGFTDAEGAGEIELLL